jgi:archaellum component FlaC
MTPESLRLLEYFAAFILGAGLVWLILSRQKVQAIAQGRAELSSDIAVLEERLSRMATLENKLAETEQFVKSTQYELNTSRESLSRSLAQTTGLQTQYDQLRQDLNAEKTT